MFYWKPFKSKYNLYTALGSELMFGAITFMLLGFVTPMNDKLGSTIGWIMNSMVIISLSGSWVFVILQQIRNMRHIAKLKEKKKVQVEIKEEVKIHKKSLALNKNRLDHHNRKKSKREDSENSLGKLSN